PGPTVGIALENFGPDDAATVGQTGKILCFVHAGANAAALERTLRDQDGRLRKQQSEIDDQRKENQALRSLVCQDHPGAPFCRP
ncbi:MAG: hypothetical protein ACYCPQ_09795, partial [Elusimicrobiota bacterium]